MPDKDKVSQRGKGDITGVYLIVVADHLVDIDADIDAKVGAPAANTSKAEAGRHVANVCN